jgi:HTH-type transcriptional regulator/antitoxin HigA
MQTQQRALPTLETLLDAWKVWHAVIGVDRIQTEEEYDHVQAILDMVIDAARDDESHPLAPVMDYLGSLIEDYDEVHYNWPPLTPAQIVQVKMEERGLHLQDVADCAPPGRMAEILSGKRALTKAIAKKLAKRFGLPPDFLS